MTTLAFKRLCWMLTYMYIRKAALQPDRKHIHLTYFLCGCLRGPSYDKRSKRAPPLDHTCPSNRPQTYVVFQRILLTQKIALHCWCPFCLPQNRDKMIKRATTTGPHMPFEQTADMVFQSIFFTTTWGDLARSQKIALLCWCPFTPLLVCLPQSQAVVLRSLA